VRCGHSGSFLQLERRAKTDIYRLRTGCGEKSMVPTRRAGQIIILNGIPRSGKSSFVAVMQATFDGVWMNLGVDRFVAMTPARCLPGIGLRPGGDRPDVEPFIPILYRAMYDSIAAHSRLGLNVVVDVAHHDAYAVPRGISQTSDARV
jgi:chloramphenicol 3-O phosphotransferase